MGLSSKQVSGDGFDWAKNLMQAGALELPNVTAAGQQQQAAAAPPPLKCPRCESTNTKFCYYNNYNRLQPRHFCKSCKRHWTKGGTLRNVPVGGGRKNKRLKTSSSGTANKNGAMCHGSKSGKTAVQPQHQLRPMEFSDQKKFSEILYQSLLQPTSSLLPDYINSGLLNPTTLPLDSVTPSFGYPPPSFEANVQFPNVLDEIETDTEAITTTMPAQWQTPMDGPMDMSTETSYWSWEDLHTMISTDEKQPWDDS